MRFAALLATLFWVLAPVTSSAQTYPERSGGAVTDMADLLSPEDEATLSAQIDALMTETGIELAVVTLRLRSFHDPDATLEEFATKLFDTWGLGDATRNDGILVLVLRNDREMRIELGAGFARDWDNAAENVVSRSFLPAFRDDRYADGIKTGVTDVINTIARPFHAGSKPESGGIGPMIWGPALGGGLFALIFGGWLYRTISARFRTCPSCSNRGLSLKRSTVTAPTTMMTGSGRQTLTCGACGHVLISTYTIAKRSKSRGTSGSSGGGRSGGGGASGRW
ncbi:MAG: YgcG family protein [Sedimentitalea sp.]